MLYDMDQGCLMCDNPNAEWHHVYSASRRPISDREGCIAPLCRYHHQGRNGAHGNAKVNAWLRSDCQRRWEAREMREFGISAEEARTRFMSVFYENFVMGEE